MRTLVRALALLVASTSCGTTIRAQDYAADCDADMQCVRITVGNLCSCDCNLAAINDRDFQKYLDDVQRIGKCNTTCAASDGAALTCGLGIGTQCSAGRCETYTLPDAGSD